MFRRIILTLTGLVTVLVAAPQALAVRTAHDNSSSSGTISLSSAVYDVNENAGQYPITLTRTGDTSKPATVCYGVKNVSSEAGQNFDKIGNSEATFAAGAATTTFNLNVHDQGINGLARMAQAYIFQCGRATSEPVGSPSKATLNLLQNDPLAVKDPANPLGYPQTPTDGDPLQFVNWYVYGPLSPAGAALGNYKSNPAYAQALHTIAYSPGSGTYRFWMWNQPASSLAATVEKFLADAEVAQPNTTIALSSYSLVHGACESPKAIKSGYENWITQLAKGIGNFRVVLYLEEDSLIETHCLTHAQLQTRLSELAYAVKTLSQDPHLLIYMDAGAPDGWNNAAETARLLKQADVGDADGFFVNATHNDWTTTDVHYGQEIANALGGKHFIVQTDDNGRGPLVPDDRKDNGNEDLCNPAGRGTGPLTWDTGYKYVDGFLWFNNPGNSDGPCGMGAPPVSAFWAPYAVGLVQRGTQKVTGPHFNLLTSNTDA
ncbi:MAG TPA: glycoside hydrolase family 6 protein [Solirubrobacteraceae bacterium]|nr:glycoside hydrolase family 6 protein [Solirubrobacteraceae bacterium]